MKNACYYTLASRAFITIILVLTALAPLAAKPDLDVTYITRTPRYPRYIVTEVWGSNPSDYGTTQQYLSPEEQVKQRWPKTGELITFTAVIRNPGDAETGEFSYKWYFDGNEVKSDTLPSIPPGGKITTSYQWTWDSVWNDHNIRFTADPDNLIDENVEVNNSRDDRTNALSFCIPVWQSTFDWFEANIRSYNPNLASFEDWIQLQLGYMNEVFKTSIWPTSPNGVLERVRLDMVEVLPEDTYDPGGNHLPNGDPHQSWDGVWGFGPKEYPKIFTEEGHTEFLTGPFTWILHEWGHQMGLVDLYQMNSSPAANEILTLGHDCSRICTMTGNDLMYSDHTAGAMNRNLHVRRGHFGEYQYDVPDTCRVRILDSYGRPIPNAEVKFYFTKDHSFSGPPDYVMTSDAEGCCVLPNRYCWAWDAENNRLSVDHTNTTATGHTLKDNPFGLINLCAAKSVYFCEITAAGQTDYQFFELIPFNLAYWTGHIESYTLDIRTTLLSSRPTTKDLYSVKMTSATHGYIVGAGGTILTWDGSNWNTVLSPTTNDLKAVDALSSTSIACAVGNNGTVLINSNGAWLVRNIGSSTNLRACAIPSSGTILAGGDNGQLYRSTNGGTTWNQVTTDGYTIYCIRFYDSMNGIMTCDGGNVYYSNNGGITWLRGTGSFVGAPVTSCSMASRLEAYACNTDGDVFSSIDGGRTWTWFQDGCWIDDWYAIDIKQGGAGWLGGGVHEFNFNAMLTRYEAGLRQVHDPVALFGNNDTVYGISCVTANDAWIVGRGGLILHETSTPPEIITDTTPPVMGPVLDGGDVSYDSQSIDVKWSASDPESGVVEYQYAVGTTPTDPGSGYLIGWINHNQNFSTIDLMGYDIDPNKTYYVYVRARNRYNLWSSVSTSDGIKLIRPTIGEAKKLPNSTRVGFSGKICTARLGDYFCIQEPDRSAGIKVYPGSGGTMPEVGDIVSIHGSLAVHGGDAVVSYGPFLTTGTTEVAPVEVTNAAIGGAKTGIQPATYGWRWVLNPLTNQREYKWLADTGLNNVGLLVKTTGKITYIDQMGYFAYIDDGSALNDGNKLGPNGAHIKGLRLVLQHGYNSKVVKTPPVGTKITVAGISGADYLSNDPVGVLRVRAQDDVGGMDGAIIYGRIGYSAPTSYNYAITTPHPYPGDYNNYWELPLPSGITGIRLHFPQIQIAEADYMWFLRSDGSSMTLHNLDVTDYWTEWFPGNTLTFGLVAYGSEGNYGFRMDKLELTSAAAPGVTVTLMPGNKTATTDKNGYFIFTSLEPGVYTVTPTMNMTTFNPPSRGVTVKANQFICDTDFSAN